MGLYTAKARADAVAFRLLTAEAVHTLLEKIARRQFSLGVSRTVRQLLHSGVDVTRLLPFESIFWGHISTTAFCVTRDGAPVSLWWLFLSGMLNTFFTIQGKVDKACLEAMLQSFLDAGVDLHSHYKQGKQFYSQDHKSSSSMRYFRSLFGLR